MIPPGQAHDSDDMGQRPRNIFIVGQAADNNGENYNADNHQDNNNDGDQDLRSLILDLLNNDVDTTRENIEVWGIMDEAYQPGDVFPQGQSTQDGEGNP
jgi:hypothetical protein